MVNRSFGLMDSILRFLLEGIDNDKIERWTFVSKEAKVLVKLVEELQKVNDQKTYREIIAKMLIQFVKIAELMDVPGLVPDAERLGDTIKSMRPNKMTNIELGKDLFLGFANLIRKELRSKLPSKSNIFLAMRLMNDILQRVFIKEKKVLKQTQNLQTIFDYTIIRKLYLKRVKSTFTSDESKRG